MLAGHNLIPQYTIGKYEHVVLLKDNPSYSKGDNDKFSPKSRVTQRFSQEHSTEEEFNDVFKVVADTAKS